MDIFELINKKLESRRQMLIEALVDGPVKDFAEHKHIVGQVLGLAAAQMEINDLARQMKEHNDD